MVTQMRKLTGPPPYYPNKSHISVNFWGLFYLSHACFDESDITEVDKQKLQSFVMNNSGMVSDYVAANIDQIFETFSRDTIQSVL